jgi:hypothetical protein
MKREQHWGSVYLAKPDTSLSWFESEPSVSFDLTRSVIPPGRSVIDVGGGTSRLVGRKPGIQSATSALLRQGNCRVWRANLTRLRYNWEPASPGDSTGKREAACLADREAASIGGMLHVLLDSDATRNRRGSPFAHACRNHLARPAATLHAKH